MEEDIKILEDNIKDFKDKKLLGLMLYHDEFVAIEHLISSYKKLEEENKEWQKAYQEEKDAQFNILINSVPKSVIEEKIEELDKEIEEKQENGCDFTLIHEHEIDTNAIIKVLQELLEKGNK